MVSNKVLYSFLATLAASLGGAAIDNIDSLGLPPAVVAVVVPLITLATGYFKKDGNLAPSTIEAMGGQ